MSRSNAASPTEVWAVLAGGWPYASWVVGVSRVPDVDDTWPAEGSQIHYSFGMWPAVMDDETTVRHSLPGATLVLRP